MILQLIFITLLAIIGNYGIAQYRRTTFYQWVVLSLLVGPLSWPLQWNSAHH
jgi:hypothetical protein